MHISRTLLFVALSAPPFLLVLTGCKFDPPEPIGVEYAGTDGIFCYIDAVGR